MKRLEKIVRPWAIPNISGIIVAGQVVLFVFFMMDDANGGGMLLDKLSFDPPRIMKGEVWRVLAFPFVPFNFNPIWAIFGWLIFYSFGTSLERFWGTVRYNLFLWIGIAANVLVSFGAWFVTGDSYLATNGILYSTVFLAFARLNPNYVIRVYFILPIQIRWLALLMWLGYGFILLRGPWVSRLLILASVANYLVFFTKEHWRDLKHGHRRRAFQTRTKEATKSLVHECLVCGLNSEAAPRTLFRYCSKCAGQCCYCPDHIHEHEHVSEDDPAEDGVELADSNRQ